MTQIDREIVEQMAFDLEHTDGPDGPLEMIYRCQIADVLRSLRAALDAAEARAEKAEAEVKRLRTWIETVKRHTDLFDGLWDDKWRPPHLKLLLALARRAVLAALQETDR